MHIKAVPFENAFVDVRSLLMADEVLKLVSKGTLLGLLQ